MLSVNSTSMYSSELESASIYNYAIKESCEIIADEVEFYFSSKEHIIDVFIESLDYKELNQEYLQGRFNKIICSPKEMEAFLVRMEGKLQKELARASISLNLNFGNIIKGLHLAETSFQNINEALRTYSFSCFTEKTIDKVWKKRSSSFIPSGFRKVCKNLKVGEYFLSAVGLTPKEIKESIDIKIRKSLQGILRQHKNELIESLRKEVVTQLLKTEALSNIKPLDHEIIKTA